MKPVSTYMNSKTFGLLIILISVILSLSLWSLTTRLNEELHKNCPIPEQYCPFKTNYPIESYVGFTGVLLLFISGIVLTLTTRLTERETKEKKQKIKEVIKSLKSEERSVYDVIAKSDGAAFQTDLVEKTGFSKVKVSRILDKLETKNIVERRRRGMSNIIILKE